MLHFVKIPHLRSRPFRWRLRGGLVHDLINFLPARQTLTARLRSLTGEQLIFSNSDLVGSRIQNYGRLQERRVAFTVGVTYDTPTEKVEKLPQVAPAQAGLLDTACADTDVADPRIIGAT